MDLSVELDKFKRQVYVRCGTDEQAMLILFAFAAEPNTVNKQPLINYVNTLLGSPKQRASQPGSAISTSGAIGHQLTKVTYTDEVNSLEVALGKPTLEDVNSMLTGRHPLSAAETDAGFSFTSGAELAYMTFHFDDGIAACSMVIAVTRKNDKIGLRHYLVKDGDVLVDSPVVFQDTVAGTYSAVHPTSKKRHSVLIYGR